jgi:hypothetical protein
METDDIGTNLNKIKTMIDDHMLSMKSEPINSFSESSNSDTNYDYHNTDSSSDNGSTFDIESGSEYGSESNLVNKTNSSINTRTDTEIKTESVNPGSELSLKSDILKTLTESGNTVTNSIPHITNIPSDKNASISSVQFKNYKLMKA